MKSIKVAALLLLLSSTQAFATDYYVDGKGGSDSNAGTSAKPFLHIWRGLQIAVAGDTVHVLPTVVYPDSIHDLVYIQKSGKPGAPITLKGEGVYPNMTKISTNLGMGIQIAPGVSYINILNFDVTTQGAPYSGIFSSQDTHHILIQGNRVHDSGGNGIASFQADYVTIKNNTVFHNATNHNPAVVGGKPAWGSGISVLASTDVDAYTGPKIFVDGNRVYLNTNMPSVDYPDDSDGFGIIVDDNKHMQAKDQINGHPTTYKGRIMIQNNVSFYNGNGGFAAYQTDHVSVLNNTFFYNNQDPRNSQYYPAEVYVLASGDVLIYNNICRSAGPVADLDGNGGFHTGITIKYNVDQLGPLVADYNMIYNDNADAGLMYYQYGNVNSVTFGPHNLFMTPLFVYPYSTPVDQADYHLKPISPALGAGNPAFAPYYDIDGHPRSTWGVVDIGAYQESALPTANVTMVVSGDNYSGPAAWSFLVNGSQVKAGTVTANHAKGEWQTISFVATVAIPSAFQTFGVGFTNDAYAGVGLDRNLYVQSVTVNGHAVSPLQASYTYGTTTSAGQVMMPHNGALTWNAALAK